MGGGHFCTAAFKFLSRNTVFCCECQTETEILKDVSMCSFPISKRKGFWRIGIRNSPHPRTDSNYRSGLCPSQSTFLQIILWSACIFSHSKTNTKHIHILSCSPRGQQQPARAGEDYLKSCQYVLVGRWGVLPRAPRHRREKPTARMQLQSE